MVILAGKRSIAERIVYGSFDILQQKTGETDIMKALQKAVDNVRPRLEVKPRRIGGVFWLAAVPDKC